VYNNYPVLPIGIIADWLLIDRSLANWHHNILSLLPLFWTFGRLLLCLHLYRDRVFLMSPSTVFLFFFYYCGGRGVEVVSLHFVLLDMAFVNSISIIGNLVWSLALTNFQSISTCLFLLIHLLFIYP